MSDSSAGRLTAALRAAQGLRHSWPALAILAAVLAVFSEAISTDRVFYQRDIHGYWYPYRAVVVRALAERVLPLWNPFVGFGVPLLADPNFELAYPPTWIGLLLPAALHFKLFAVGHTLLAAAGATLLARRLGVGAPAAAVAGLVYALSGPMLSVVNLFHHHCGAAWLPWVLWALEGLLRRPAVRPALVLGTLCALQVLAGSGDMCLVSGLLGGARLADILLRGRSRRPALGALAAAALLAALVALSLSAVQWLPTLEVAWRSVRGQMDLRTATYWSLHPLSLFDLVVPRLVADLPLHPAARAAVFEGRGPLLGTIYLGVVTTACALVAVAQGSRPAWKAAGGASLLVLLSLGRHTPLYGALFALPGFSFLRYPQKLLIPAALAAALLAGFAVERWRSGWSASERRRARAGALVLLALALVLAASGLLILDQPSLLTRLGAAADLAADASWTSGARLLRSALLVAIAALCVQRRAAAERASAAAGAVLLLAGGLDQILVARGINLLAPAALLERVPAAVPFADPSSRSLFAADPGCRAPPAGAAGWSPVWASARANIETLLAPTGARWGLYGSYDGEFSGLGAPEAAIATAKAFERLGTPAGLRLLQLGNVGRVFHTGTRPLEALVPLAVLDIQLPCSLSVLRVPEPLPRVYLAAAERAAGGLRPPLDRLLDPAFDVRREVLVDAPVRDADAGTLPSGEARLVARTLDSLELSARVVAPSTLVVVEAYDPNWQAEVDGRAVPVLRANGLFRGVRLEPGEHRVVLRYRPWSVEAGALASTFGVLGLVLLARRR